MFSGIFQFTSRWCPGCPAELQRERTVHWYGQHYVKNSDLANKAVQKFNGAPIDGGRSRLKLNVIIDPTKAAQDLTRRIQPLPAKPVNPRSAVINKARGPTRKAALAKRARHQKKERPAKKSLEDLDKEMADYFGEKK